MDINKVLNEYDAMYGKVSLEAIEDFLFEKIKEAMNEEDTASLITLLNEMIGLCRDTTQKEKALTFCNELHKLLDRLELQDTQSYATSMLNIANAYRAFGLYEDALNAFTGVENCYKRCLDSDDFLFASLYNNWGLLYQEIGDYAKAKETLLLALRIVDKKKDAEMPKASTLANLGAAMILLPEKENKDEAVKYIKEALELFEADGGKDFHYSAALTAMGDAYYGEKDY
ncbi:MAG: tetratricopeptide repeat protein, partial [Lachnospiraceae bacterium]|nr:tetratricopeptide repeat protein [Lachnospiraceae bacterium]